MLQCQQMRWEEGERELLGPPLHLRGLVMSNPEVGWAVEGEGGGKGGGGEGERRGRGEEGERGEEGWGGGVGRRGKGEGVIAACSVESSMCLRWQIISWRDGVKRAKKNW